MVRRSLAITRYGSGSILKDEEPEQHRVLANRRLIIFVLLKLIHL